ncbi:peroxidase [Trichonephila inaurata madagascariensis]|uniref:Peroxidase n=1 Tax=Trichonephila inaurata madagascariensis TaxID=2747483 RepID=A0A8X6YXY4_9ARAC|nr:peroxidase [Trichonephila inaurata madagascariensis]
MTMWIHFYILVSIWLKVSFSLEDKGYIARLDYDKLALIAREKREATEFSSSSSDYYDISEDADNTYEVSNDSDDTTPEDPNRCRDNSPLQCDRAHPYRTFDGTCNNLDHPTWGSANECYLRFQKAFYDGYGGVRKSVTRDPLPEPRNLTVNIFRDVKQRSQRTSFMLTIFGQAVAHDLGNIVKLDDKAECCSPGNESNPACLPIRLSPDDPDFSRYNVTCRNFQTSKDCHLCDTANKESLSDVTSFLDASIAYGNSDEKANSIRRNDGTGDERVNQHATLTSIHTLYMREHNRLAAILKLLNPQWDEEQLFQEARRINIAQVQCITYKEYLPYVIGPYLMEQFDLKVKDGPEGTLYNPRTRPGIVNEFSTSAFRLHSMVASNVGALRLLFEDLYSNPKLIWDGHMNQLMQGVCRVSSAKYDHWFVKDVTVSLRRPPGKSYGSDLSSMDIQRGRDTGLAPYIYLVKFCSGNRYKITSFEDLSPLMSMENIELLKKNYKSVEDVDLGVGLHMENHLPEAEVGPTTACIIAKQFYLIKFGDRFYFEHEGEVPSFTPDQRNALKQCSFSRLLCDNTNIPRIQKNVMLVPDAQNNPNIPCNEIPEIDLSLWKE